MAIKKAWTVRKKQKAKHIASLQSTQPPSDENNLRLKQVGDRRLVLCFHRPTGGEACIPARRDRDPYKKLFGLLNHSVVEKGRKEFLLYSVTVPAQNIQRQIFPQPWPSGCQTPVQIPFRLQFQPSILRRLPPAPSE